MCNQSEFLKASGQLDHEAVRAHFLRIGKLEGLAKDDLVYVDHFGRWIVVRLIRRVPGDCWIAEAWKKCDGFGKVVVMASNFGGKFYS
jgi:hypothetical protein